jgi:hypothetical protein
MNVAPMSGGKSPTSKPTIERSLGPWNSDERDRAIEALREWKRGFDQAKAAAAENSVGGDDDPLATFLEENPKPERRHILSTDITFERLEVILGNGATPGLLIFHDEMGRWFSQLCRAPNQSDREKWLGLYTGAPILTDRIGREDVVVTNPAVSLFGNFHPGRIAGLWKADIKAGDGLPDADGLWARFLMVALPEWDYTYRKTTVHLHPALATLYKAVDTAVTNLPREGDKAAEIALAEPALELFDRWTHDLLAMRKARGLEEDRGFVDKQRGGSMRLALILHAIRCASCGLPMNTPITAETMQSAILQTCLFISERDQLLAAARDEDSLSDAKRLLARGAEWRAEHGNAPVPLSQIRDWRLPKRSMPSGERIEWLQKVVGGAPGMGRVAPTAKSVEWHPPEGL